MEFFNQRIHRELCLLHLINKQDYESYHLMKKLNDTFNIDINQFYATTHSLVNIGYLESYDVEKNGKKEKHYLLSSRGKDYYEQLIKDWHDFQHAFNLLISEEEISE